MNAFIQKPAPNFGRCPTNLYFSQLLGSLPVAAYTCDVDGLITYFNERAVELWGREPKLNDAADRFCGSFKLFSADGAPVAHDECWMALALRNRRAYNGHEIQLERPDGGRCAVLAHASPILDESGELLGAVNVLVNITDRQRSELVRSHLAAIVDSSDDAIISKDLNGVIQSWNGAAQRLFGYTAEQAVGRHISLLIPPERLDEEDRILSRLRAGERVYHFDTVRLRQNGESVHVSLTISPILDASGRIVGASKIVRDISERKRAEERIYQLMTELKNADRRKDDFVATLAHELRNPLAAIKNGLEIMNRGDDGVTERFRAMLNRQVGQLSRLVDDLLDLNRISHGKIELRKEVVDLASIVQRSVEGCRPLLDSARHQLDIALPSEPIRLHADAARLVQVFGNLLNNACKYTRAGGQIRIKARRLGDAAAVSVQDTGVGIPADKLASVFDMFTQLEPSLERAQGGLGIGLALVKRLVEVHGGTVEAHSEGPGRGSEFVVRLPIFLETARTETNGPALNEAPMTGHRILIVDDNRDATSSLEILLTMIGNQTRTAHDGLEAVEAAAAFRPHVVLLDISLPKLNGYDVCRHIRAQPWGKNMVLMALTGWGQAEDRRLSKEAGFDHHLVKPLDFTTFTTLLATLKSERNA
jgi:two-component system, chemotaxis family, CheB/CheR fusion protein